MSTLGQTILAAPQTIRDIIIMAVHDALKVWTDQNTNLVFQTTLRGPPEDIPVTGLPAVGVYEGTETMVEYGPYIEHYTCRLFVTFEFARQTDVDNYTAFNYYLGQIKACLTPQVFIGGAINFKLTEDTNENASQADPTPSGTLTFEMQYRTKKGNPFQKA